MIEWHSGEPKIREEPVRPVRERWMCPKEGCVGEMVFNGTTWMTCDPGYHHTCSECGHTAAVRGATYPRVVYKA